MAITNHERVGRMLELLTAGLRSFVERELRSANVPGWFGQTQRTLADMQIQIKGTQEQPQWDVAAILVTMGDQWDAVFGQTLGQAEQSMVRELRAIHQRWAEQRPFSTDDTYRALDSGARLLASVSAAEADDLEKMKMELLRLRFDEQVRTEKRRNGGKALDPGQWRLEALA